MDDASTQNYMLAGNDNTHTMATHGLLQWHTNLAAEHADNRPYEDFANKLVWKSTDGKLTLLSQCFLDRRGYVRENTSLTALSMHLYVLILQDAIIQPRYTEFMSKFEDLGARPLDKDSDFSSTPPSRPPLQYTNVLYFFCTEPIRRVCGVDFEQNEKFWTSLSASLGRFH